MEQINKALDRIKKLECPTGEVENRVIGILEDYNVANKNDIIINRNYQLDNDGTEVFSAKINNTNLSIIVLAKSGMDDYVAKVENVYIS
ncbi:MAG: hypothetical protein K0Q97_262 [Bacillota bacterium]|jgi:hypothetical protein|nr:hypothetical protein [Bacillota bacterium]